MNIQTTAEQIEKKWLGETYGYCRKCFSGTHLPSHDEIHHLRVWYFAKTLLPEYHKRIHELSREHIEGILLAAMLHDTGMSQTLDITHGRASRRLAETFFLSSSSPPALADDILAAVEKHDDKSYSDVISTETDQGIIFSVLSLADDLDAFGATGVFRYYEIYLLRGFEVSEMATAILPNLDRRYESVTMKLASLPNLLTGIEQRYLTTRRFFEDLKTGDPCALRILDTFEISIRKPGIKPEQAIPEILKKGGDPCVSRFFRIMQRELSPPVY